MSVSEQRFDQQEQELRNCYSEITTLRQQLAEAQETIKQLEQDANKWRQHENEVREALLIELNLTRQ